MEIVIYVRFFWSWGFIVVDIEVVFVVLVGVWFVVVIFVFVVIDCIIVFWVYFCINNIYVLGEEVGKK